MSKGISGITATLERYYLAARKRFFLMFFGRFSVVKRRGINFLIDIYAHIDRRVEAYGVYEEAQLEYLLHSATSAETSIFIDAGANFGLYSVSVARALPHAKIYAFEPDARARYQLYGTLYLNDLVDRVIVSDLALSEKSGLSKFERHDRENPGRSRLTDSGNLEVKTCPIDDLFNFHGLNIALKIDVEDHEMALLNGARNLLERNNCLLQIESFSPTDLIALMNNLSYENIYSVGNDYFFSKRSITARHKPQSAEHP